MGQTITSKIKFNEEYCFGYHSKLLKHNVLGYNGANTQMSNGIDLSDNYEGLGTAGYFYTIKNFKNYSTNKNVPININECDANLINKIEDISNMLSLNIKNFTIMAIWENKKEKFVILTLKFLELDNKLMFMYVSFKVENDIISEISYSDKFS